MKHTFTYLSFLLIVSLLLLSGCDKDTVGSGPKEPEEPEEVEGSYIGLWTATPDDFPTQNYKDNYEKMELTFNPGMTYSWKWYKKDGNVIDYSGTITQSKSTYNHTSTSAIWDIQIDVTHINGNPSQGGWKGIYTYENAKTLVLNVEPNVVQTSLFPTPQAGVGSGQSGMAAVFIFHK